MGLLEFLLLGIGLGVAAGTSPGPLMTLVFNSTLAHGFATGMRVSLAPLLTDLPVIVLCLFGFQFLPDWARLTLSIFGGLYVVYLGLHTLRSSPATTIASDPVDASDDIVRSLLVNLTRPHPWLFWGTVGVPLLARGLEHSAWGGSLFVIGFYVAMIAVFFKLVRAVAADRERLSLITYRRLFAGSGSLLIVIGFFILFRTMMSIE